MMVRVLSSVLVVASLGFAAAEARAEDQAKQAPTENWATARARLLTEEGNRHRAAGSTDLAVSKLNEAIAIDATYAPAYLALASLREANGEVDEALRVLAMCFEHVPSDTEGMRLQTEILIRAKRWSASTTALLHLSATKPDDEVTLRRIVEIAPRARLLPVALAAARRLSSLAAERGDTAAEKDARLTVRALQSLLGEADPVVRGRGSSDRVRRALARAASK